MHNLTIYPNTVLFSKPFPRPIKAEITNDVVLYMPLFAYGLEHTNDLIEDLSFYGNNGTRYGTVPKDKGWSFDGVDDYILIPDSASIQDIKPITLVAWVYPKTDGGSDRGIIFFHRGGSVLRIDTPWQTNSLLYQRQYTTNAVYRVTVANVVEMNKWQCFAATWDGGIDASGIHIYKNAVEQSYSGSMTPIGETYQSDAGMDKMIGNNPTNTFGWDGLIGELIIYKKVLSQSQLKEIFELTRGRYGV